MKIRVSFADLTQRTHYVYIACILWRRICQAAHLSAGRDLAIRVSECIGRQQILLAAQLILPIDHKTTETFFLDELARGSLRKKAGFAVKTEPKPARPATSAFF